MSPLRPLATESSSRWVGVAEASHLLGVHPTTLRQWTDRGRLRAFLTPGGHRRYREDDLRAFRAGGSGSARHAGSVSGRSLAAAILTAQPRCGFSGPAASARYSWLGACDEAHRARPRLLGGALTRLLARYTIADEGEAARCLDEARSHAAEYGTLTADLGLTPAAAVEAFTVCRAPLMEAAERWSREVGVNHPDALALLARLSRFLDATLLALVAALPGSPASLPGALAELPATPDPLPVIQDERRTPPLPRTGEGVGG